MANTRILIVDDHVLFRESLTQALSSLSEFTVYSCGTCGEALEALTQQSMDIVLLDFDLGADSALNLLRAIPKDALGSCRFVLLTAGVSVSTARELLASDCVSGLLVKDVPLHELRDSLVLLMTDRRRIIDKRYESAVGSKPPDSELDERDRQVLRSLLEGYSNKEIASRLFTSESTVKNVLQVLFHKFDVRTRSQLVRVALEQKVFLGNTPADTTHSIIECNR